ncbi:RNA-binding protein [Paraburkholderia caffeinilytica]|uniref:RNA-binding protein n=1 Tax=Paraburkholderia caffeinilytica TaxID=1761016 RepID=UPI0038BB8592
MTDLWVGNVEDDTPDEEIREFLVRYGFPSFDEILRVEGTGTQPAVVLSFNAASPEALRSLQPRVHNLFWKSRTIVVHVMPEHGDRPR